MNRPTPRSVCAIVINRDVNNNIQLLAVNRPNKPDQLALPGGKIDPGETPEQAVIRELKEETNVEGFNPVFFHTAHTLDGYGYCECFYIPNWVALGGLHSSEPLNPRWVSPEHILDGPYFQYNTIILQMLHQQGLI